MLTVTPSGPTPQEIGAIAIEYTGLVAATPLDQTASRVATGGSSPWTFDTGTTAPTVAADELLASVATACPGFPDAVGWTEGSRFVMRASETDTVTRQPGFAADKVVATKGAYNDAWTITFTGSSYPALGALATFR